MSESAKSQSAEIDAILKELWLPIVQHGLLPGDSLALAPGDWHSVWSHSIGEFRAGRRQKLSLLFRAYFVDPSVAVHVFGEIPKWGVEEIANIILGTSKPDARGKKNLKLKEENKEPAIRELTNLRNSRDCFLAKDNIDRAADKRGIEPAELIADTNQRFDSGVEKIAAKYGISVRTLKNLCKPSAQKN
jgi:hypothetical protein